MHVKSHRPATVDRALQSEKGTGNQNTCCSLIFFKKKNDNDRTMSNGVRQKEIERGRELGRNRETD